MARSWSGFLPLNQEIKEEWGVLEESRDRIDHKLQAFTLQPSDEDSGDHDDEEGFSFSMNRHRRAG